MRGKTVMPKLESGRLLLVVTLGVLMMLVFPVFNFLGAALAAQTYEQNSADERKVMTRVEPDYPEALKRLYIGGVVRVEVVIAPNGVVRSTKLLGGSPILGQSSMKAIKQWKYAPAPAQQVMTVKVEFDPHR
jgi:TonB family protein